jgi:hypothetical protein
VTVERRSPRSRSRPPTHFPGDARPALFRDDELELYRLEAGSAFEDRTQEIEDRL